METNNKPEKKINSNEKGALWVKYNEKGTEYFSIKINLDGETLHYKAFLNGEKTDHPNDKRPHFLIFESKNVPNSNN